MTTNTMTNPLDRSKHSSRTGSGFGSGLMSVMDTPFPSLRRTYHNRHPAQRVMMNPYGSGRDSRFESSGPPARRVEWLVDRRIADLQPAADFLDRQFQESDPVLGRKQFGFQSPPDRLHREV